MMKHVLLKVTALHPLTLSHWCFTHTQHSGCFHIFSGLFLSILKIVTSWCLYLSTVDINGSGFLNLQSKETVKGLNNK